MVELNVAQIALRDAEMRRILYELLYSETKEAIDGRPCPSLGDDWVAHELHRVLFQAAVRYNKPLHPTVLCCIVATVALIIGFVLGMLVLCGGY